jgi:uncharacterized membrane protein YqiK
MNLHDMPSPGQITRGQSLVLEAFRAINYTRVAAERQPDGAAGDDLRKFFLACAKLCPKAMTEEQIEARNAVQAAAEQNRRDEATRAEAAALMAKAEALASSTNPADGRGSAQ